jgi:hypothetical protein
MWKKYGRTRQAKYENIMRPMRIACWITKATDTHSKYVILLFHGENEYANAPKYYVNTHIAGLVSLTLFSHFSPPPKAAKIVASLIIPDVISQKIFSKY